MAKRNVKKGLLGLIGLLGILAIVLVGCDEYQLVGVWQLDSLQADIEMGDYFSKTVDINFSEVEDVNVLMQFTEDIKSMYFEQDGEIIKCVNLDRRYDIILQKIQVLEENGGVTEWDFTEEGDTLTITMAATLSDYPDAPKFEGLPPISATMTWVLHKVSDSIVEGVNEAEDCTDSPMHRHSHRHRHLLMWKLVSDEEA